jgi:hypothetical protein
MACTSRAQGDVVTDTVTTAGTTICKKAISISTYLLVHSFGDVEWHIKCTYDTSVTIRQQVLDVVQCAVHKYSITNVP